jgi:hypothetical protein
MKKIYYIYVDSYYLSTMILFVGIHTCNIIVPWKQNWWNKSFASGVYNQQFKGTFKKTSFICITPSQGNQTVLKFDQPYIMNILILQTILSENLIIHEELLQDNNNSNLDKTCWVKIW